ncbi:MAG: DUF87 domain-containing protein [Verrucomicrobiaceae bacterium]|nr:DUF87 domain-containing protein [Verrucomicrobiaceae bacterium]
MNEHDLHIGMRHVWGGEQPFGFNLADAGYHTYIIGKTGSGKTTLLRNLILQLIQQGHGVGLIDPHGDLAEDLLLHIPPQRAEQTVYFHPGDLDHPIGLSRARQSAEGCPKGERSEATSRSDREPPEPGRPTIPDTGCALAGARGVSE